GAHSIATFDQSASISSARMSGSEVIDPCPISAPALRMVTVPSRAMRTQGVTFAFAIAWGCACENRRTPSVPSARQNDMPPRPTNTPRREISRSMIVMALALPRSALDGGDNAVISAAAADVAVHVADDLRAGRFRVGGEQLGRLHDLARLAIAALGHFFGDPGLLQRVRGIGREALDGDDGLALKHRQFRHAGALGPS